MAFSKYRSKTRSSKPSSSSFHDTQDSQEVKPSSSSCAASPGSYIWFADYIGGKALLNLFVISTTMRTVIALFLYQMALAPPH